jgi:tRNA (cytidine32/uridine32-2'-O)-methyltransferase
MLPANIRLVLVNTTHPGNIGAAARAMKNMGFERLYLVQPELFPHAEATARASGADDLLASARICHSLDEALQGCSLVFGTSARRRKLTWPELDTRQSADLAARESQRHEVAFVFGREHSGLTNEELQRCHYLVHIPCNPSFSSLNMAAAVQVLVYELMMHNQGIALGQEKLPDQQVELATADEMEGFYRHLSEVLVATEFLDPANPRHVMRRLRRLFNRARPDKIELNILRGILTAVLNKTNK